MYELQWVAEEEEHNPLCFVPSGGHYSRVHHRTVATRNTIKRGRMLFPSPFPMQDLAVKPTSLGSTGMSENVASCISSRLLPLPFHLYTLSLQILICKKQQPLSPYLPVDMQERRTQIIGVYSSCWQQNEREGENPYGHHDILTSPSPSPCLSLLV